MKLPAGFKDKMLKYLGENEYRELEDALINGKRQFGLRVNTLKISVEEFAGLSPFNLERIPWTSDGFYISAEDTPGKHPYYHAGLYYIQEPSAMLPGRVLDARPGEKVLDLCAAPGGKTIQIASAMQGNGLLVSNDINGERVKALVKNVELCGVRNTIILNETPENIAEIFGEYFDRVLVDAPCSGEGMFRKDEPAARAWKDFKSGHCAAMQEKILLCADRLLKPGGTLVYSTCTFSPEENERVIGRFLLDHRNYATVDIEKTAGIEGGRPGWIALPCIDGLMSEAVLDSGGAAHEKGLDDCSPLKSNGRRCCASVPRSEETTGSGCGGVNLCEAARHMARIWPHRARGEGHFAAKLQKTSGSGDQNPQCVQFEDITAYNELPGSFHDFACRNLNWMPDGVFLLRGGNLYHLPERPPALGGLRTVKSGWYLGSFHNGIFEPSHSMVTAMETHSFKRVINLDSRSREVKSYLKGETLMLDGEKGLTAVCVDGFTLGWAKQMGGMLKNMYPKGWRMQT